ncbi:hypothetical protein MHUMG1_07144 [Metarhizium humberi]|uniref:Uncharacterized protein n=1 Tax=Metarhizium humberi TaxID=2596975 RepID=A0A9P8M6X4_9HYPO|nr:hypothetical protein MHUMG1_07144 [Metarhizium humberi]
MSQVSSNMPSRRSISFMANVKDIRDLIMRQWYEDVVNKRPNVGLGRVLILTPYLQQKHLIQHYVGVTVHRIEKQNVLPRLQLRDDFNRKKGDSFERRLLALAGNSESMATNGSAVGTIPKSTPEGLPTRRAIGRQETTRTGQPLAP